MGLPPDERRDHLLGWYAATVVPWLRHTRAEVEADPLACAARFARSTDRCCVCAARLHDAHGRLAGACVGCRDRLSIDTLSALLAAR